MQGRRLSIHSLRRAAGWSAAGVAAAVLAACGGSSGTGGTAQTGVGTLKLALTDAPACGFDHVYVTIDKVRVHQSGTAGDAEAGWSEVRLDPARRIDLLTLTNGAIQELGATQLPAGDYGQMRLVLASQAEQAGSYTHAVQPTGGAEVPLTIPSGEQSGFKVQGGFGVAAEQTADLVLDFDACNSVVSAGATGTYLLKPVVSVMPRSASGIQGSVATTLPLAKTMVSAQQGGTTVRSTQPDERGNFRIPFLQPGSYTLVISAEGHATGVVTGVPVDAGTTTSVNQSDSAIALPHSAAGEIVGVVAFDAVEGQAPAVTPNSLVQVRTSQRLTGGESVEVKSRPLDGLGGTFSVKVPDAAPVKAAYNSSGRLAFTADGFETGKYSLDVLVR